MFTGMNMKSQRWLESASGKDCGCLWLHSAHISSLILCTFTSFRHHFYWMKGTISTSFAPPHLCIYCPYFLKALPFLSYPSPWVPSSSKNSWGVSLSRKFFRLQQTELWPFLPLSSPCPIVLHHSPFSPALSHWGARSERHSCVSLTSRRAHGTEEMAYWLDNSWNVSVCVLVGWKDRPKRVCEEENQNESIFQFYK